MAETYPVFARCVWTEHVPPSSYNKEKILTDIKANYAKSRVRNVWGKESDFHHAYDDSENPDFIKIDYSSLISAYEPIITQFLLDIGINCNVKFTIENYTVSNEDQYMQRHDHTSVEPWNDFSSVHYIECDEQHAPLTFYNDDPNLKFFNRTNIIEKGMMTHHTPFNSYMHQMYNYPVKQDYLTIFPSDLAHGVLKQRDNITTKKDRICIVSNIKVKEE